MKYKVGWEQELERRERLGITGPEPILHPDDVQLNFYTGEVTFTGPITRKEKAEWDLLWDRVEEADQKIELGTNQLKKIRSKMVRNRVEAEIAAERSIRDAIVSKIGEPRKRRRS